MKYASSIIATTAAIVASASLARAETASEIAECIEKFSCGTDVNCNAKCFPSAAPTVEQVHLTNDCIVSSCTKEVTYTGLNAADCQVFCVEKYFLAPNYVPTASAVLASETSTVSETATITNDSDNLSSSANEKVFFSTLSMVIAGVSAIFLL